GVGQVFGAQGAGALAEFPTAAQWAIYPEGSFGYLDNGELDLGLVRLREESDLTGEGMTMGTLDYMAPEQAEDSRRADIRADLYALGCTLYFLLAGRPPFPGGSMTEKVAAHRKREADAVEALRPDCPADLAAVVRKLMAKDPRDRFQTPAEVVAALASEANAEGRTATWHGSRPARPSRRWLVAVPALLLVLAVAAWRIWPLPARKPGDPPPERPVPRPSPAKAGELFRWKAGRFDLSPTGRALLVGRGEEPALVVDLIDGRTIRSFPPAGWGRISPDGKRVFLGDGGLPFKCRLLRVDDGAEEWDFDGISPALFFGAFSADGSRLALGHAGEVVVFDLDGKKPAARMKAHGGPWLEAAFCQGDTRLLTGGRDRTVVLWDSATGERLKSLEGTMPSRVDAHCLDPARQRCLLADAEGLHVRDLGTWQKRFALPRQGQARIGPSGRIVTSSTGGLAFWSADGAPLGRRPSPAGNIHAVAISPDGARALSGHRLGEVLLWEV
ncbi:MAG: hypothetical protein K2X91_12520, partial [Thermoleophilia bacterium]|nr:hypothetical protein [Thermoleophilia bacterium]